MYWKRDGEKELSKLTNHCIWHSACYSISRGVLLSPLAEDSAFTIFMQGVPMHFQLLLLGPPKKGVKSPPTSNAWHALHTLVTTHPAQPVLTWEPSSFCGKCGLARGSQVRGWERDTAPRLSPETPRAVTEKAQQQLPGGRSATSSLLHPHCLHAGGEAPHFLQGELFKSNKRKLLLLGLNLNNLYTWSWYWVQLMSTVQLQVQGLCFQPHMLCKQNIGCLNRRSTSLGEVAWWVLYISP